MEGYQDIVSEEVFQSNLPDEYLSDKDDYDIKKLDIIHLFGKEKLESIQKSLSKATGVAFVTVDFRGEPITEVTSITRFCKYVRSCPAASKRCKSSDAFGSIQAAVMKKTNIYFCPCGLLEVAIPIIVRGHYLGGFIGGQVRCVDAPESICCLSSVMHSEESEEVVKEGSQLLEEIPLYPYEKFLNIANLVFMVINLLSENEINKHMQEDTLKKRIEKVEAISRRYRKEKMQKERELLEQKVSTSPYEWMDVLTSILNMTIIEEAPKTGELLSTFIEYTKYNYTKKETFVHVLDELEHAEQYLKLKQKKMGERLTYSIFVPKEVHIQKIPSGVLLPFIQSAVYNGILLKKDVGEITVTGYLRDRNVVLEIQDNGLGLNEEELNDKYEVYKDKHEGYYIKLGIEYAHEKMKKLFGNDDTIIIENYKGQGRKIVLSWPVYYEERKV